MNKLERQEKSRKFIVDTLKENNNECSILDIHNFLRIRGFYSKNENILWKLYSIINEYETMEEDLQKIINTVLKK